MNETMTEFSDYLATFQPELKRLRAVAHAQLSTEVALIADMEENYLIGGKRLRAVVALLSGRLCGLDKETGDIVAAAIEFIHTATLLHDDVIDDAPTRRHLPTARRVYGNAAAVLAGDFLYSRASQLFANLGHVKLLQRIADTTNRLAEGEVMQLLHRGNPDMEEKTYYAIIDRKTANLFAVAAAAAAILTDHDDAALCTYGYHLGVAFQLIDDCLDYDGESDDTGKKIGTDFNEGKMTLPVILMLLQVPATTRESLISGWMQEKRAAFNETLRLVNETGALAQTRARAVEEAAAAATALAHYPPSESRTALMKLAQISPYRKT